MISTFAARSLMDSRWIERVVNGMSDTLYDRDFFSWTEEQVALIRAGRLAEADLANLAEEIETLGRSEAAALRSAYRLIAMHLLKIIHQPDKRTPSWDNIVSRERLNIEVILGDNPGLAPKRAALFEQAYRIARREAALETMLLLKTFPAVSPFGLDDVEREDFWP